MCNKKWPYRWLLLLIAMLPTLIVLLLTSWFSIDRPLIVYEYFLIGFLFAFNVRSVWPWLFFVFLFALDIAIVFSKLYLFNLPDLLNAFKYLGNYSMNAVQIFLFLITFLALFGIFVLLKVIKIKIGTDKVCLRFFTAILVITFALDNINGTSVGLAYNQSLNFHKKNFAGLNSLLLYRSLVNRNVNSNAPILIKESVTFKEFASDSTSSHMLIIVESFGLINDSLKREVFQKNISTIFERKSWKTRWGKTLFTRSTTSAELRELLNCEGDYRYFLDPDQSKKFNSIFQIKKKQGFHTYAIHSYKGNMFERSTWWKNIGADEIFFSEDVQIASNFQSKLNFDTPFVSVNDENSFKFIQAITETNRKQFVYFLTENAHLPFKGELNKSISSSLFDIDKEANLSEEAKNQNKRIMSFLAYVATHLDPKKFQKILIVGDHMPPFVKKDDRVFYNDQFVPYFIIWR